MGAERRTTRSPVLDETTGAFVKARASDRRQRIMALLADGACLTVNEITQRCGLSQPTTSEHLGIMREADLVTATRSGNYVHYRANATAIATCLTSLRAFLVPGPAAAPAEPTAKGAAAGGPSQPVAPIREPDDPLIVVRASPGPNRGVGDAGPAEEVLRDVIPDGNGAEFTVDRIMEVTSEYYGVSLDDVRGHSRSRAHVNVRQVVVYLCRELTELSLPQIGHAIGGRDHTTVIHADRKIRRQMAERGTSFHRSPS